MRSTSISAFSVPRTNRHTITATLHRSISILENGDPHRFSNSIVRVCTRTFACPFVLKRDINNAAGYYEMQRRRRLFARRILSLARHLTTIGLSRRTREEREREGKPTVYAFRLRLRIQNEGNGKSKVLHRYFRRAALTSLHWLQHTPGCAVECKKGE